MKVKVTNKGKRQRQRFGWNFEPQKSITVEVSPSQRLALRAVRDFEVKDVEEETASKDKGQSKKSSKR